MNQFEIEEELDKLLIKAESDLEKVFGKRLKTILFQLSEMYRKFEKNGELSFTELNKYNRFQKEMNLITELMSEHYREVIRTIQEQAETQYVAKYLLTAYVVEMAVSDGTEIGYKLPSITTMTGIVRELLQELEIPKLERLRDSDIKRILDKHFGPERETAETKEEMIEAIRVEIEIPKKEAKKLADRIIKAVDEKKDSKSSSRMGFTIPSTNVIQSALDNPVKELTLPKVMEQHRNETVRKINIEIAQGLIAGEGYTQIAKRLEKEVGFASNKARLVARTEVGRARSLASERVNEVASQYVETVKVWASMLDNRVRMTHRFLDGKEADNNGVFTYKKNFTTAPRLWVGPDAAALTIQCRCVTVFKVGGKLPEYRRERDYMDDKYQQKLADRIDKYMADDAMTYKQALKKAQKEIQPPSRVIPYVTFEDWKQQLAGQE